jgi:hypothetical protein
MAYAAIIGALVNTGFDIYNQVSKPNPQQIASQYSDWLKGNAMRYIQPFTDPSQWALDIPGMAEQSINFGLGAAPAINQENMTQLQALLNQAMPGYSQSFGALRDLQSQMQANASSLLTGAVPQDVQDQIRRNAAFTSLMGGSAGAGLGTTGAITARDLGLTSLQLKQEGQTAAGGALTAGTNLLSFGRNYLMPQPVNPLSLLPLTDLVEGAKWSKSAAFQANEAMYTAMGNVAAAKFGAPTTSLLGGIGGDISGLISALGKQNPQTGQSGMSGIMGMLGGLFGGGGGGGGGGGLIDTSGLGMGTSFGY